MTTMNRRQFHAALNRLETMAKAQGATQLFHTPSDSNPGTWPNGRQTDLDEHTDGIGTDYRGVKKSLSLKVANSEALTPAEVAIFKGGEANAEVAGTYIKNKINAQQPLTPVENWFCQGGWNQVKKGVTSVSRRSGAKPGPAGYPGDNDDAKNVPDTHAGENESDEVEHDAKKSLPGAISESQQLGNFLELSPFLNEFAGAMAVGLEGLENRMISTFDKVTKSLLNRIENLENCLSKSISEQGEFNKGFAETIVGIGQHVAGASEIVSQQAQIPIGPPKSQFRVLPGGQPNQIGIQPIEKSFATVGSNVMQDNYVDKSDISQIMVELVKSNKLNPIEVVKFETTGELSSNAERMIKSFSAGQK